MLAGELASAHARFRADEFADVVAARLPDLELKERIAWIATCPTEHLPGDYRQAVKSSARCPHCVIPRCGRRRRRLHLRALPEYVARHGCTSADLDVSLAALRELTMRFSAEGRPGLQQLVLRRNLSTLLGLGR